MKLYLAAVYTSNFNKRGPRYAILNEQERYYRDTAPYILESYHYIHKQKYIDQIAEDNCKIFLDSGAFSAFSKGAEIDIRGYVDYIHRNRHIIDTVDGMLLASVLDGIGDPLKTYQNQIYMEQHGIRPLPCFHYGEDERYLDYYVANYGYITLGGMVPVSTPQLYHWLDRIFDKHLTDGAGRPKVRVHGFGLTTVDLMERYPWYSVDSSSWVQIAMYGNILHPDYGTLAMSTVSPALKEANRHYDTLNPAHKEVWRKAIEGLGFDIDRLKEQTYCRWTYNMWAFLEINRRTNIANKVFKAQPVLF
jgi:hypothetical protein